MNDEMKIIEKMNEAVSGMERRMFSDRVGAKVEVLAVQTETQPLGKNGAPIYVQAKGLKKDEDMGALITNEDLVFFIDDISDNGFVKLYLFGSDAWEYAEPEEFKKEFKILC